MKIAFSSAVLLLLSLGAGSALTPGETCELCQIVLRTVYGHFSANVPSRKKLVNQLKHECKRHFNYRRRCLMAMKDQGEFIFREMATTDFKPIKPCFEIKECKRLQSPLPDHIFIEPTTDNSTTPDSATTELIRETSDPPALGIKT